MQTGRDRSWSRPYNAQDTESEYGSGTHVGPWACLNIRNRQPGMHYAYGTRKDPSSLTSMRAMGFDFVREGDPEALGLDLPAGFGTGQDTCVGMGNLVLMRIPLSLYRKRCDEAEAARQASRAAPTRQFLDRNHEFLRGQRGAAPRTGAAFAYPEHGATGYRDANSLDPDAEE